MPRLKADFVADWVAHLRKEKSNKGMWPTEEMVSLDDRDVRERYFDAWRLRRRISAMSRRVRVAAEFTCPQVHQAAWKCLQDEVRTGTDINPRLSTGHASLSNPDGLLSEFGVHHFHLGTVQSPKNPTYLARTRELLFALVTDTDFCAINVYGHGSFADVSVLEIIHRNWPELISQYRVIGVTGGHWTADQRRDLRRGNGNILTAVADGTVYMPITGGVMASGVNVEAVKLADYWKMRVQELQTAFESKLEELLPTLRERGYAEEPEIDAQLRFPDGNAHVFFPKYNVSVIIAG
jgi:hypothetical protein